MKHFACVFLLLLSFVACNPLAKAGDDTTDDNILKLAGPIVITRNKPTEVSLGGDAVRQFTAPNVTASDPTKIRYIWYVSDGTTVVILPGRGKTINLDFAAAIEGQSAAGRPASLSAIPGTAIFVAVSASDGKVVTDPPLVKMITITP